MSKPLKARYGQGVRVGRMNVITARENTIKQVCQAAAIALGQWRESQTLHMDKRVVMAKRISAKRQLQTAARWIVDFLDDVGDDGAEFVAALFSTKKMHDELIAEQEAALLE